MRKQRRTRVLVPALVLALAFGLTAHASEGGAQAKKEIIVFAAASMTETLTKICDLYKEVDPDVSVICNFDSSGTLKTQIEEGADCDIFISAAPKQMDGLDITAPEEANPDKLDFVDPDTRLDLLENEVTLVVPEGNPKEI